MKLGYLLCTRCKRGVVKILLCFLVLLILYEYILSSSGLVRENKHSISELIGFENRSVSLQLNVHAYYEKRKHWATSNLGSILFKNNMQHHYKSKNKSFVILIWRYWSWLKTRHHNDHDGDNPFDKCSVDNCIVTSNESDMSFADAVVIHVQHGVIPKIVNRRPSQRWVFLSDESPVNSFSLAGRRPDLKLWANIFNWSMTYSCPGHFKEDCPTINKYMFYLSFENTNCRQYLTEKIFYNAYSKGAIPVIMGAPKEDCDNLLPPYSFLHVDNYPSPKELAEDMKHIAKNENHLLMYHQWRRHYELINEHGYFGTKSYHLCRLCEALNYNDDKPKVYGVDDLKMFFEPKLICNLPEVL